MNRLERAERVAKQDEEWGKVLANTYLTRNIDSPKAHVQYARTAVSAFNVSEEVTRKFDNGGASLDSTETFVMALRVKAEMCPGFVSDEEVENLGDALTPEETKARVSNSH